MLNVKVLAVSDVVVYRTRAERLHNDLFYFLGDASKGESPAKRFFLLLAKES